MTLVSSTSWKLADLGAWDRQVQWSVPHLSAELGRARSRSEGNQARTCVTAVCSISCPSLVFMPHAVLSSDEGRQRNGFWVFTDFFSLSIQKGKGI